MKERMLKEVMEQIDSETLHDKNEARLFIRGIISGLYVALDYDTFEKLEKEIREQVEEKYDLYIGI